ncbi:MAG: F0F1 ATP synthase subunit delta [Clostridiales bacterium]|nr:F0F1 ATP synthase subunit delta [Clostridiales bacterium]MCF8022554.1 F0F1 ATP synthase subunit delta [Clostridiales bacterium]
MLKGAVAGRYAEALYEVAVAEEKVDQLEKELLTIANMLEQEKDLQKLLNHPRITAADKKNVLKASFEGKISEIALNFVSLVIDRGRENFIPDMINVFVEYANQARNISDVEVTSAVELSKEERANLVEALGKVTGKEVRASHSVDPSLIGGVVVQIGDKVMDGTVKARLQSLREHLRQIS